ncbi:MAG: metallophosphoesterase family protein [Deltaproteobacteria bacterium]|nr:metallophosphoesterase family protein [Deltaproteobacteria bacterium]
MRFLCISDVHGELNALRAVLATAERRGYQKILVAGDLCFPGPEPLETWRTLQREQAICVQGVTDKALATMDPARLEELAADPAQKAIARKFLEARKAIGELVLERLRRLPTHHRMTLEDGRELLLVHGSPEDPTEPITHDLDDDEILALIGDDPADVIVCGMAHTPFVREVSDVTVINVGSVGDAPGGGVGHATFIETSPQGIIIDPITVPLDDLAVGM